jgi:hypothetical protein
LIQAIAPSPAFCEKRRRNVTIGANDDGTTGVVNFE